MTDPEYTPTPMTLAQRTQAAQQPGDFPDQIRAGLLKHARWVRDASQPANSTQLAYDVMQDPDAYVLRFASWYLVHPNADAIETVTEISDTDVMDMIPTLWDMALAPE